MMYTLFNDGDGFEKHYWEKFIEREFPSYEKFWQKHVTVLTNRPDNIHTKSDVELKKVGKNQEDVCIVQLHYAVLKHLIRVYEIRQINPLDPDQFIEGLVRTCAALDVADELLERVVNRGKYDPWVEKDGEQARYAWRKKDNNMRYLRNYRNRLLHGHMIPTITLIGTYSRYRVPKFGREDKYLDWRKITDASVGSGGKVRNDFDAPNNLLNEAWDRTLKYLERNWKKYLL